MKITNYSKEILEYLYSNYNYDNIIIRDELGRVLYKIPSIIALDDIECSNVNWCSTKIDGVSYASSYFRSHLMMFTGLTPQQYFDILVLHINDTEDRPRCARCGAYLPWSNRITSGYASGGHKWTENDAGVHFCSRECAVRFQYDNPDIYTQTAEFQGNGGTFGFLKYDKELWTLMQIRSRRTFFLNLGNIEDDCLFYLALTETGRYKFGITSNLNWRNWTSFMVDGYCYSHKLISGTRLQMANLEANIKYKLGQYNEYLEYSDLNKFNNIYKEFSLKLDHLEFD